MFQRYKEKTHGNTPPIPLKSLLLNGLKRGILQRLQLQELRQMHVIRLLQLTLIHVLNWVRRK